jgi:hypothetical protein
MKTPMTLSIFDTKSWPVWVIPVNGPRRLVGTFTNRCTSLKGAHGFNYAAPWVFHDVRRVDVAIDDQVSLRIFSPERTEKLPRANAPVPCVSLIEF